MMAQTTWTRARMCFWGIFSHCSPFRGSKTPNPQFWGVNRCFQAKLATSKKRAYYQNYCIDFNQILHSDKGHQRPFVGGPDTRITNPRWRTEKSKNHHISEFRKSKMAAAAILKNRKIAISQPQFERFSRETQFVLLDRLDR